MRHLRLFHPAWLACAIVLAGASLAQAQDCKSMVDAFNKAIDAGNEGEAQKFVDRIAIDADCGRFQVPAQRRLAAFRLQAAHALMAKGRPANEYERFLAEAEKSQVLWQAAATLGDVRFGERRFADAARAFDRAIDIIKNETLTPNAPSKF